MSEIIEFPSARERKKRRKDRLTKVDMYKRICVLGLVISSILFITKNPEVLDIKRTLNSLAYIFKQTDNQNKIDINNVESIIEFDSSIAMIEKEKAEKEKAEKERSMETCK